MHRRLMLGLSAAILLTIVGALVLSLGAAASAASQSKCNDLPDEDALKAFLIAAPAHGGSAGGLFSGKRMWGAIVNRDGELCSYATSTADPTQVYPLPCP